MDRRPRSRTPHASIPILHVLYEIAGNYPEKRNGLRSSGFERDEGIAIERRMHSRLLARLRFPFAFSNGFTLCRAFRLAWITFTLRRDADFHG